MRRRQLSRANRPRQRTARPPTASQNAVTYWLIDSLVLGVRAVGILAAFQAVGAYVFLRLFESGLGTAIAPIRALVRWSALLAVLLAALYYFLVPVRLAGGVDGLFDPTLSGIVAGSNVQTALIGIFAGLGLIAASVDVQDHFNRILCLIGAGVVALSFALTGHTTVHPLRPLLAPALVLHVAIAAVWLGSLWPLRIVVGLEPDAARTLVIGRFSRYALRAVPLLFACGAVMAVIFVGSIDGLFTAYSVMLSLKVVGFAAVLAIANYNRTRLAPAMARNDAASLRRFRQVLLVETFVLVAIVVATIFMTGLFAPANLHAAFGAEHGAGAAH